MGVGLMKVLAAVGQTPPGRLLGMPTNTMFQTLPVQLPHCALREIHCCWEMDPTSKSTTESDIHPPLTQPKLSWRFRLLPRICMRRKGHAWENAHLMPAPGRGDREVLHPSPEI